MVRLGFLGGGTDSIAGPVHFIASQMDGGFEVVGGLFSRETERSEKCAEKWGVRPFASLEEMAQEVDIAVLLTPTPNHYGDLKKLLRCDIGIICDKPLVASMEEASALAPLLAGKFIVVTHNYSGYPLVRELGAMIAHGELGRLKKLKIEMPQESFFKPMKPGYPQPWRLKDGPIPTLLLDLGVHLYHLAAFLHPERPEEVFAELRSFSDYGVVDDATILAKNGEIVWEISCSKTSIGRSNPLVIEAYGDRAGARWSQEDAENLIITYANGKKEIFTRGYAKYEAHKRRYNRMAPGHPAGFIEAFANLYVDIREAYDEFLREGKWCNPFVFDARHSMDSLAFLTGAVESMREKTWKTWKREY